MDCSDDLINAAKVLDESEFDYHSIEKAALDILEAIGEDPKREGLIKTPGRVAKAYAEIVSGYRIDPCTLLNNAIFTIDSDQMVIVRDIEFYSLCEHHLLPFFGHVHVAYIPNGKVIGLSKIPRIVEMFARRVQIQERMTQQIADFVQESIKPEGVAVVIEGQHLCMMMRGIKKQNASMTTSAMLGAFRHQMQTRMEFLNRISMSS